MPDTKSIVDKKFFAIVGRPPYTQAVGRWTVKLTPLGAGFVKIAKTKRVVIEIASKGKMVQIGSPEVASYFEYGNSVFT